MAERRPKLVNKKPRGGPMGGGPVQMTVEKPKNFRVSMGKLLKYFRPHKSALIGSMLLLAITVLFSIVSPKILGNMTNQIVDDFISIKAYDTVQANLPAGVPLPAGTTLKDLPLPDGMLDKIPSAQKDLIENLDLSQKPVFHYDKLAEIGLFLAALYLIGLLANYLGGWVFTGMVQKIVRKMRSQISHKINKLPIKYFDQHQFGDTLSRVTNDVDTVGQSLNQAVSQGISAIFMLLGIVIMMFTISWLMTLIALVVLPISFLLVGTVVKKSQKHFAAQQNRLADLNGHIEETYAGQQVVRVFGGQKKVEKTFGDINQKLYVSTWKSQFLSGLMMPLMNIVSNLGYVAAAVLGGWLALNGRLNIGDIQAFIQYMGQINQPISQVAQIANLLQSTVAAAERVFTFLEEAEESPDPAEAISLARPNGQIDFENVVFGYETGKKVIRGFSAHIKPGQKVAIVGPTGAGKTTIINLLMRFYEIDSGQIKIDGINTKQMRRQEVRGLFGMVLQDTWLASGTIADNLRYGKLDASEAEIEVAAKAAHVDHFVKSLPQGYQTPIDESSENISVGERQLLTIARAMVADAPMLILDEATSSVDTRTEVLIQQAMEKLMKNRTSFVIAHRLSTIANSDLILVMKDGNVVEQGNHRQLLRQNGFYAKLYKAQFTGK
ncbi:MAG: ABC transporter ATP-binding protein/permease [Candidatus Nomurabacteria bacterium]|jgi:ATP-binding cassette subfamily B protein|nr:ABC transporter ATP-binding protein/permease [Candidatus Nomurabacteria bacterium]